VAESIHARRLSFSGLLVGYANTAAVALWSDEEIILNFHRLVGRRLGDSCGRDILKEDKDAKQQLKCGKVRSDASFPIVSSVSSQVVM